MRVLLINGPNLNLLGTREPDIYGDTSLNDLEEKVVKWANSWDITIETFQSNSESAIVDLLQKTTADSVIINPGGLTHTSRVLADTIGGIEPPVVEVHISNVKKRESWRAESVVSDSCIRTIYGRGILGYRDALLHLRNRAAMPFTTLRYGPASDNIGDLRGDGDDLVVLAHGGIWRQVWERDTTESIAVDLAHAGYTTWNLEYRRLGNGGGWPGSGHDVLTALDHISNLDRNYKRVVVIGHSAGSYLLVWAAQRSQSSVDLSLQLAGVFDLKGGIKSGLVIAEDCQTMLDMGAPSSVEPQAIPTVLFHGTHDHISDVNQSTDLADRSASELVKTESGHFEWLDPTGPEWQLVKQHLEETR